MIVTFCDPHPGLMGCTAPIPEHLRIAASQLDGKKMTPEEAVKYFQDAAPKGYEQPTFKVESGCILAKIGTFKTGMCCWRVIRFKQEGESDGTDRTE